MKYRHPVTPSDRTSSHVQVIKRRLAIEHDPIHIDVQVAEHALVDECFPNVALEVERSGGRQVLGWALWELPGIYFEAEFHAVWEKPDGTLVDITPKKESTSRILFLRDPNAIYAGLQVNNLRVPISREPAVLEFLEACEAEFELTNSGDRSGQYGEIALTGNDAARYTLIQQTKMVAMLGFSHKIPMIGPYTPCPCGCGQKTKWCDKRR
ncbi:hypothetical protein JFN94_06390 [Burkholderia anthina]|uniref:SEC-C domain-containing protein n=1 Tax=Burkholderia anthina TaxID=179879 RepID=A0A7T6VH30_9BURK|nr:hypothetical protein [Burkholderia anthina]QQK03787.1 hypothetical protein JFN94_06390 [Burkholderia anthina]